MLLILYGLLVSLAAYWAVNIDVYFSKSFFVSDSSEISAWFATNEKYFTTGGVQTITYVENSESRFNAIDFSAVKVQNRMHGLNEAIQECKGCTQNWH